MPKLLLVAGQPSHPHGMHEFRAGAHLLRRCLQSVPGLDVEVAEHGDLPSLSPGDVDAMVMYADGGEAHPANVNGRRAMLDRLAAAGTGLGFMHYAVEMPDGEAAADLTRWIGGCYIDGYSCNPIFDADFSRLPEHPITRGVTPFTMTDEWYFNIRFIDDPAITIIPVLTTIPSDAVRRGPYVYPKGPYAHVVAAGGRRETLMWATERPDGGRGFGFTGGHFHANWANDNLRRLVLNALIWVTGLDVPPTGAVSSVTKEDLRQNLDDKHSHQEGLSE